MPDGGRSPVLTGGVPRAGNAEPDAIIWRWAGDETEGRGTLQA